MMVAPQVAPPQGIAPLVAQPANPVLTEPVAWGRVAVHHAPHTGLAVPMLMHAGVQGGVGQLLEDGAVVAVQPSFMDELGRETLWLRRHHASDLHSVPFPPFCGVGIYLHLTGDKK